MHLNRLKMKIIFYRAEMAFHIGFVLWLRTNLHSGLCVLNSPHLISLINSKGSRSEVAHCVKVQYAFIRV